jgi:hypothetical protein
MAYRTWLFAPLWLYSSGDAIDRLTGILHARHKTGLFFLKILEKNYVSH